MNLVYKVGARWASHHVSPILKDKKRVWERDAGNGIHCFSFPLDLEEGGRFGSATSY